MIATKPYTSAQNGLPTAYKARAGNPKITISNSKCGSGGNDIGALGEPRAPQTTAMSSGAPIPRQYRKKTLDPVLNPQ